MPRTQEEQEAWEMQAQGCLSKDFLESVKESTDYRFSGSMMVIMSLLSDAQEEIAMGMSERARQTINKAKLVLLETGEGNLTLRHRLK